MRILLCLALLSPLSLAHAQPPQAAATADTVQGPQAAAPTDAAPAVAVPAQDAAADANEKICKVGREIGSNKLKRVCRTRAQLDAEREAAREALTREQRR